MRLGQHFLKNKKQISKIINTLDLQSEDVVVELGPGHGELTEVLRDKYQELRVIAIEKDEKLAQFLGKKFKGDKKIKIIEGDILKVLPSLMLNTYPLIHKYKLVGNIPYYLTGYLLRIISELENKPSLIVLTIQKEVARRIVVKPPKMNLLAASVQYWAEPKIIGYVPAMDFSPAPKVDSAIIKLSIKKRVLSIKGDKYYTFIKILFSHPRKMILNNLSCLKNKEELKEILKKQGIKENARPQDLSINAIKELLISINNLKPS